MVNIPVVEEKKKKKKTKAVEVEAGAEDESSWSQDQQKALEAALAQFPKVNAIFERHMPFFEDTFVIKLAY